MGGKAGGRLQAMGHKSVVTFMNVASKRGQIAHTLQEGRLLKSLRRAPDLNRLQRIRISTGHRAAKANHTFMSDHAAFDIPAFWHRDQE
jgi:hypothetical protein